MIVRFDRQKLAIVLLVAMVYIPGRLLFNSEGDVTGAVQANAMLFANAIVTLFFAFVLCLQRRALTRIYVRGLFGVSLAYYLLAFLSTLYSGMMIVTAYQATIGLLFTIAGCAVGRMIAAARPTMAERFELLMEVILLFSVFAVCANAVYFFIYFGVTDFLKHGVPSDFVVVLVLFCFYVRLSTRRCSPLVCFQLFMLLVFALFLKSFSAIASFGVALIIISVYEGRFLRAFGLAAVAILGALALFSFAAAGIGEADFMGKPAEAYLTGSGRFDLYMAAVDVFFNEFSSIQTVFGAGFMAERLLLMDRGLPWITDPHNSIILSGLGLGGLGLTLYFSYLLAPFYLFRKIATRVERKYMVFWVFFHYFSAFFGWTSSFYIGRPSFLAIFSLAFLYLIYAAADERDPFDVREDLLSRPPNYDKEKVRSGRPDSVVLK
jgi:hypothetical protein